MASMVGPVLPEDVAPLIAELGRKSLPLNPDRVTSGAGYSQAFGIIRRWSYKPGLSRNCWRRPALWQLLQDFAAKYVTIPWDAVQVNQNYESKPHKDVGNQDLSYIVSFGDYTGGELFIDVSGTEQIVDTRLTGHLFNGSLHRHWNRPIDGTKISLVFFRIIWPPKFEPRHAIHTSLVADGLRVEDEYDSSIVVLDTLGRVVRTERPAEPRPFVTRPKFGGATTQS